MHTYKVSLTSFVEDMLNLQQYGNSHHRNNHSDFHFTLFLQTKRNFEGPEQYRICEIIIVNS
jgi:hypothetical protein